MDIQEQQVASMSRIAWIADSPSPHSPANSTSRCEARCRTIFSRAKGSSSMNKVRIMPIVSGPVGKFHGDTEAAARARAEVPGARPGLSICGEGAHGYE